MKEKVQKFTLLLAVMLTGFCLAPQTARAQISSGTTINLSDPAPPASGTGWTFAGSVYTILNGATVTVTGSNQSPGASWRRIEVAENATVSITLDNAIITGLDINICSFLLSDGADVTLTITGTSTLSGGNMRAGVQVPEGTAITIDGDGTLNATGGIYGAGIGGGNNGSGGTITIYGGTINANGQMNGAGIGGGFSGSGGTVTINGGTVYATGGTWGAGVGGGVGGSGGTITINDGTVNANGSSGGAGIGGGSRGSGGTITINDGTVNATGSPGGAGVGGGSDGSGGTIAINGGTVIATGGTAGAGIGGGGRGASGDILIIGNTNVTSTGGDGNSNIGGGAGIGSGGTENTSPATVNSITITTTGTVNAIGAAGIGRGADIGEGGYNGSGSDGAPWYAIDISAQPDPATTLIAGSIAGSLSVTANLTPAPTTIPLNYQWYSNTTNSNMGGTTVSGATSATFAIPATLAAGTHYYYCVVSATGATDMPSNVATLTVTSPPLLYNISIGAGVNGSIVSNKASATAGTIVTLTATPSAGYELDAITVHRTGSSTTTITVSGSGATRTFVMPAFGVTVDATFKKTAIQMLWEQALAVIAAASYNVPQSAAANEADLSAWLADYVNELLKTAGVNLTITAADIWIQSGNFAPASTTANGTFEFFVLPRGVIISTMLTGTILSTVGNEQRTTNNGQLRAYAKDGVLYVSVVETDNYMSPQTLRVYNLNGTLIYIGTTTDVGAGFARPLPGRGIYIVQCGDKTIKVVN